MRAWFFAAVSGMESMLHQRRTLKSITVYWKASSVRSPEQTQDESLHSGADSLEMIFLKHDSVFVMDLPKI